MANKRPTNPIQPGQTRNPNGRPKKGTTFSDIINEKIDKAAIIAKLEQLALKGDVTALKYIVDRVEGSPRQAMTLSGEKDAPPVSINIIGLDATENAES